MHGTGIFAVKRCDDRAHIMPWTASSGATSNKVYRATNAGGAKILLGSPAGTAFADTTATPGVTYYYWVKACKGTRCSIYSTANTGWRKP